MTRKRTDSTPSVRCAIYTRKSTDEGLDQDFNSLDAQRESAESLIASQRAQGWECLAERYDDGGFSGGSVERPALQRLMADIEAGRIDCVVVYKVDRLSRSLMDFARLMEVFERRGVSFVSVTQQFNTTHSMGRLTLNILLSFAQFEREIISERTRDKIAAARRKGKWAGGRPVLGYDLESRPGGGRLHVNPAEAERVRRIFAMYLEKGSMGGVIAECRRLGWTTKRWTTKAGKAMGGHPLDKGRIHKILTNPAYLGKVRHHDQVYEGEHEAIIDRETFDRTQERLRFNGRTGGAAINTKHHALLSGLVRCKACGCAMTHHYACSAKGKQTKRYRYYVCTRAQKQGWAACPGPSLPAGDLEGFVVEQVKRVVTTDAAIDGVVERAMEILSETRPELVIDPDEAVGAAESFEPVWDAMTPGERRELVGGLVARVEWDPEAETISVTYAEGVEPVRSEAETAA
jgi:site-specific DNA recombinase